MLKRVSIEEFQKNTKSFVEQAVIDDDYLQIVTVKGSAVLISEAEYKILRDALKMVLCAGDA